MDKWRVAPKFVPCTKCRFRGHFVLPDGSETPRIAITQARAYIEALLREKKMDEDCARILLYSLSLHWISGPQDAYYRRLDETCDACKPKLNAAGQYEFKFS
jgi:hypothetical protein